LDFPPESLSVLGLSRFSRERQAASLRMRSVERWLAFFRSLRDRGPRRLRVRPPFRNQGGLDGLKKWHTAQQLSSCASARVRLDCLYRRTKTRLPDKPCLYERSDRVKTASETRTASDLWNHRTPAKPADCFFRSAAAQSYRRRRSRTAQ